MRELKMSVYDPFVNAFREVTLTEEEAKERLGRLKKDEKKIERFLNEKDTDT